MKNNSTISKYLSKKQDNDNISNSLRSLLPSNIKSKAYIKQIKLKTNKIKINKDKEKRNNCEKINNSFEKSKYPLINKVIINLIKTENELKQKISKYNYNEKLLKNKSYINAYNISPQNLSKDKTLIKDKINTFEKNKEICSSKINYINSQINSLKDYQDKLCGNFKQRVNSNLIKLNKSKSCKNYFEKRLKDLSQEQNKRTLAMQKDIRISSQKKIRELNNLEKEKEDKKNLLLKEIRDKEREDIIKRNQKNMENFVNRKKYINEKPKKEQYLYQKILKNYIDKEKNLVKN